MTAGDPTLATLLPVIASYQAAHDRRDSPVAIAAFAPGATVLDDGATYVGTAEIRGWLDTVAHEFTFTRTLTGVEQQDDRTWIVRNHLAGDFPGGTVDLAYRFVVEDDLIQRLEIAP